MDEQTPSDTFVPDNILKPLIEASYSSTIDEALEYLIATAKTSDGRSSLASKEILVAVLNLCQYLVHTPHPRLLLLSLKLLRNLCAGEIRNQDLFIRQNGASVISRIIMSTELSSDNIDVVKLALQLLGNVSLAGEEHKHIVWSLLFPNMFFEIARIRSKETCDPLCMIIYTCTEGHKGRLAELCTDQGLQIVVEIFLTVETAGFREDWLKLLLQRICLEESYFPWVFSKLRPVGAVEGIVGHFGSEQAFFLRILSEMLNEGVENIFVSHEFAFGILGMLKKAISIVDFTSRGKMGLPTGNADVDTLGYSLAILRDICACDNRKHAKEIGSADIVDTLVSSGLVELLVTLLLDLEPPTSIRKAMQHSETREGTPSPSSKCCPYKGLRRDVVAIIGNCCYRRKHVQDEIRERGAILLLLQQCVTDEDNPFLREWGIWSVRNLLEGNAENQQVVADLELRGSVDLPDLAQMGLRVEVDPKGGRAKLVNVS